MKINVFKFFTSLVLIAPLLSHAQTSTSYISRPIGTAAPFLNFTPDARRAALGEAGVASSPDANSAFWNLAQLPFADKSMGASVSYTPWLRDLVDDMAFMQASFYKKIAKNQVLGISMVYFDEGQINFTTAQGNDNGTYHSKEFGVTASYARKLSKNFGMGLNLRYINSDLIGTTVVNNTPSKVGTSVAGDISAYYTKDYVKGENNEKVSNLSFGAVISNLGGKISYGRDGNFLPTNLKVGGAYTKRIDAHNKFTYLLDFNKLLVPSTPLTDGNGKVISGKDPSTLGVINAMFSSFGDSPAGFNGEMKEVSISTGLEYWYNELFAVRTGYFFESQSNGGRKYLTTGLGLRLKDSYGIDLAYLIPTGNSTSPLANTWRISLIFDLEGKKTNSLPVTPTEDTPEN